MKEPKNANPYYALDDIGIIGSQDPADQPTAEELAAISQYFQEQKQRRAAETAQLQQPQNQGEAPKKAA